jgi:hypothetical protein
MTRGRKIDRSKIIKLKCEGYTVHMIARVLDCSKWVVWDALRDIEFDLPGLPNLDWHPRLPNRTSDPLLDRLRKHHG